MTIDSLAAQILNNGEGVLEPPYREIVQMIFDLKELLENEPSLGGDVCGYCGTSMRLGHAPNPECPWYAAMNRWGYGHN